MTQRLLIIACLLWASLPVRLSAICALPPTPCEALTTADVVFIADIVERTQYVRTNEQGRPFPDGITVYEFNVLEGLKGIKTGEFQAQFYFGLELDGFKPGSRYLIFANRAVTGIYKSGCSRSREITKTGEQEWFPAMRAELDLCLKKP